MTTPTPPTVEPGERASIGRVLTDQRKAILVALGLATAVVWVAGQLGEWRLAGCIAAGIGLGMVNHLATEYWLLRIIANGRQPTRATMMRATLVRLLVLTTVALALAVTWWPDGIGLLLGLAVFRLVALVMTTIPLLKELKSQ